MVKSRVLRGIRVVIVFVVELGVAFWLSVAIIYFMVNIDTWYARQLRYLFLAQCFLGCFLYPSILIIFTLWRDITRCSGRVGHTCSMWYFCISSLFSRRCPGRCVARIQGDCCVVMFLPTLNQVRAALTAWGCMPISLFWGPRPFLLTYCFPFRVAVRRIGVINAGWILSLVFSPSWILLIFWCLKKL